MRDKKTKTTGAGVKVTQNINVWDIIFRTLNGLKKKWVMLPIFAMVFSVLLVAYSYKSYTPMYRASATFTLSSKASSVSAYLSTSTTSTNQLVKTFPYLVNSTPLRKVVTEDLGLGYIPGTISVTTLEDTNMITMSVDSYDYQIAYDILKSVINN